jgi:endonuclease G
LNQEAKHLIAADITLPTGIWNLNDALIGTLSGDRKNGTKSICIQNIGKVTMKFNSINGASSVSVLHAKYGTDASSSWELGIPLTAEAVD